MKQESNPGILLMVPSPGFSGRGGSYSQKVNSPFSALLHVDSYSSLEAAFEKKSRAYTNAISGCHEGWFLSNCKEIPLKKHCLFLFHVSTMIFPERMSTKTFSICPY